MSLALYLSRVRSSEVLGGAMLAYEFGDSGASMAVTAVIDFTLVKCQEDVPGECGNLRTAVRDHQIVNVVCAGVRIGPVQ